MQEVGFDIVCRRTSSIDIWLCCAIAVGLFRLSKAPRIKSSAAQCVCYFFAAAMIWIAFVSSRPGDCCFGITGLSAFRGPLSIVSIFMSATWAIAGYGAGWREPID